MWTCTTCNRIFEKTAQAHSCQKIPLEEHFKNKEKAKELFNFLFKTINEKVGKCQIVSIPCCVHLFGRYDFLAALPKKDKLEIRFGLNRKLDSPRLKQSVPVSCSSVKNCVDLSSKEEVNNELIEWLSEAYFLKEKN
ncbi:MAG: hypothetical protein US68_C0012G0011 [Candidatus Shapirobacteria bacterium GW2011_GWE1_38_10]|uniref:DUF5655 domain-containing protein n=1 Tax=Candidatus Shapirobacteria bacterium GW2011_GWE1_38_10 TaxID=1618488 RepID=A0A0G0LAG4_9BACT|nr:MAG: hypothetical protein US46_C0011G0017 [Candidatus Shapirobacteria bacterium GW2011_GWF2_37_20]KKQ49616.1 MAG: hypothetical protein US68_C0012G0011 [Candidatus Shapirobacteria bacterium GW2011_GWE1_38_10]